MKKFLPLILALSLVSLLAGCASNDTGLIGNWALDIADNTTVSLTFTADTMSMKVLMVSFNYEYEASKGSGKYWVSGLSLVKTPMTYALTPDSNSLTLTMSGVSTKYKRIP